jgi:hypothetical protein
VGRYAISLGLLLVPIILWNLAFFDKLPPAFAECEFWRDIPAPLSLVENVARVLVFTLPFAMPLEVRSPLQRWALVLFGVGVVVYFGSWLPLMLAPQSAWSTSAVGFLAPAYTPALWLFALAIAGRRLFWGRGYRWWMYVPLSVTFLAAHVAHVALVFARQQQGALATLSGC